MQNFFTNSTHTLQTFFSLFKNTLASFAADWKTSWSRTSSQVCSKGMTSSLHHPHTQALVAILFHCRLDSGQGRKLLRRYDRKWRHTRETTPTSTFLISLPNYHDDDLWTLQTDDDNLWSVCRTLLYDNLRQKTCRAENICKPREVFWGMHAVISQYILH